MNYDNLYRLAFEFKKEKIWNVINESEIFAVKLSDGRIGYITITGQSNEVYMLALYIGDQALQGLLRILFDSFAFESSFEQYEIMLNQNCLQCVLETKNDLESDEIDQIKKYAKKHKIKLSGKNTYPVFMKYSPYRMMETISSKEE